MESHLIPAGAKWADFSDDDSEVGEGSQTGKRAYILFKDAVDWPSPRYVNVFYADSEKKAMAAASKMRWFHVYCPATNQIFGDQPGEGTREYHARAKAAVPAHVWSRYVDGEEPKRKPRQRKSRAHNPTNLFDLLPSS